MRLAKGFLPIAAYEPSGADNYYLLPFRFHPLTDTREVLVNEVGDFLVCPRGTATRVVNRDISPSDPLYADLTARFFISPKPLPDLIDVLATRYRTKKSFLDPFTALHIIVVTLRCNHSCHYCQVSRQTQNKREFDISTEDLERAVDLIFQSPAPELTIEFQGGEPLLAFDKIKEAVLGAKARNKSEQRALRFVVCTNLTVATDEMLQFCKEHSILISTSLDGPSELHDVNRPVVGGVKSSTMLREGIKRAREIVGFDRVSALMTTSRFSLEHPEAIVNCYRENGFDHVFLRPMHPYGFARRLSPRMTYDAPRFLEFFKRCLLHILDLNRKGEWFVEDYSAIILKKMLTPFPVGFVDLQSPSGLVTGVAVYNYDGGVYASDESRMLAETGDTSFRLGHVSDSYEELFLSPGARRMTSLSVNESLAGCADCGLQSYCGSDPVRNHAQHGDIEGYRPTSAFCAINMEIIRFLLELMDRDAEAEAIFRRWAA
jgi:His-Xaa-Ser system radical SAM maturase HxsB